MLRGEPVNVLPLHACVVSVLSVNAVTIQARSNQKGICFEEREKGEEEREEKGERERERERRRKERRKRKGE
jgi:stringent starvation protein B